MVKLAKNKLSKIHKRVMGISPSTGNGRHYFAVDEKHQSVSTRPFHQEIRQPELTTTNRRTTPPEGRHVVFMGVSAARSYNTKDVPVISLSYEDVDFPDAKEVLRLRYEPGEITREQSDKVVAFVRRHAGANIMVHCTYGEQRSRGVAHAISEIQGYGPDGVPDVWRYHNNIWVNDAGKSDQGDTVTYKRIYSAFRMNRRAEKEQEKTNDQVEVLPVE